MSDKIKCAICDKCFNVITWKHLREHTTTIAEYKELYPFSPIFSPESLRIKKESASRANKHRKGVPRTNETKAKISNIKKHNNNTAWNKNKSMSSVQKKRLSNIKKQQYASGELTHWNIGNNTSIKTKNKISNTLKSMDLVFTDESKRKRQETIDDKKQSGWVHHNTLAFNIKLQNSDNVDASVLYNDREWLYTQHITNKKTIASICVMLGLHWRMQAKTITNKLKQFDIPIHRWTANISVQQQEIENFLDELGVEYISNTRKIISPYELDIYIPEYNLAIEYNGLFWHSEIYKDVDYHLMKTEMCENLGIRLIHIFEDEWINQPQKCKDTLKHLFNKSEKGVYARKCTIQEIPWIVAKKFLDKYHLLDAGSSGNYRIGAFNNLGELVGVMVFGRLNNENSDITAVELKRFVTDKRNNPGLGSKMFKYAIKQKEYDKIIAFVDRRWFTGLVKEHIGFKIVGKVKPSIWWTDGTNRHHRRFVTKQKLIEMGGDENLSKRELLRSKKFIRIWDCGKFKLQWECDN